MLETHNYTLECVPDSHDYEVHPYRIRLCITDDPIQTIRDDGRECPDDTYSAFFPEPDGDNDGTLYIATGAPLRVVAHECGHAIIDIAVRRDVMPTGSDHDADWEELLVNTIGVLTEHVWELVCID